MAAEMPASLLAAKATSRYPACAIEEYASIRFTLFCTSAPKFPRVIDSAASTQISQNQCVLGVANSTRRRTAKAAALGPVDINAVAMNTSGSGRAPELSLL